jgi:hypothetical protein
MAWVPRSGSWRPTPVKPVGNAAISPAVNDSNGNHRYAHFGLGDATKVDTLRIEWPSGIVQELRDVPANQILTVTEPPRLIPQGAAHFQIQCWINQSFDVEASTDLRRRWSNVATVTNLTGTLEETGDPAMAGDGQRLLRRKLSEQPWKVGLCLRRGHRSFHGNLRNTSFRGCKPDSHGQTCSVLK